MNVNCDIEEGPGCPEIYYQNSTQIFPAGTAGSALGPIIASQLCDITYFDDSQITYPAYIGLMPRPSNTNNDVLYNELINQLNSTIIIDSGSYDECSNITRSLSFTDGELIRYFDDDNEVNNYVMNDNYGLSDDYRFIAFVIKINDMDGLEYTIQYNHTKIPDTSTIIDPNEDDTETLVGNGLSQYFGFSGVQLWIENAIIRAENSINNNNNITYPFDYALNYFIYPSKSSQKDAFWDSFSIQFPTYVLFIFITPISLLINSLVVEKSEKIRNSLMIMGSTQSMYWLSWFIWFTIESTLIYGIMMLADTVIDGVFKTSNKFIIFLWFWLFALSQNSMWSCVTTFVDDPKIGGFIGGFGFWLINFVFSFILPVASPGLKKFLFLLPNAAFMEGQRYVSTLEQKVVGIQWDNIGTPVAEDELTMEYVFVMLFIDALLYGILTIYCDNVAPSKFGQKKKWNYCCKSSYWKNKRIGASNNSGFNGVFYGDNYEKLLNNQDNNRPYISIRDIAKTFVSEGKDVKAVDGVNLDIYKGQVFALLGYVHKYKCTYSFLIHLINMNNIYYRKNGAGKTTLINMLTGGLSVTSGNAMIDGFDLKTQLKEIRRNIGLCPQHDVLWPLMNARQHLWLYGRLKGIPKDKIDEEMNKVIQQTGMEEAKMLKKQSQKLSGGQKRKLSLAIALIGGSRLVFLDEPTRYIILQTLSYMCRYSIH